MSEISQSKVEEFSKHAVQADACSAVQPHTIRMKLVWTLLVGMLADSMAMAPWGKSLARNFPAGAKCVKGAQKKSKWIAPVQSITINMTYVSFAWVNLPGAQIYTQQHPLAPQLALQVV